MAFGLLTIAVTLGLALSTRILGNRRGKLLLGWHQTLVWTALAMLCLHMAALAIDPIMRFGVVGVLVPGAAPWRPVPVAAGIVTGWLMLALALSFHVRRRIGQRRWRLLHYTSFAAFALGLYHALNVGTDLTGTRGLILAGSRRGTRQLARLRAHPDAASPAAPGRRASGRARRHRTGITRARRPAVAST